MKRSEDIASKRHQLRRTKPSIQRSWDKGFICSQAPLLGIDAIALTITTTIASIRDCSDKPYHRTYQLPLIINTPNLLITTVAPIDKLSYIRVLEISGLGVFIIRVEGITTSAPVAARGAGPHWGMQVLRDFALGSYFLGMGFGRMRSHHLLALQGRERWAWEVWWLPWTRAPLAAAGGICRTAFN